jgi:hypothetical protein
MARDLSQLAPSGIPHGRSRKYRRKEHLMLDVVMLVLGLGFFALSIGYAYACERL